MPAVTLHTTAKITTPHPKWFCQHADCIDGGDNPFRTFSRKADLSRYVKSFHSSPSFNCSWNECNRKEKKGFRRYDHLIEHIRNRYKEGWSMSITGKAFSNPSSIAVTGLDTGQVPATLLLNETETSVTATCSAYGTQYITSCLDPTSTGRRQQSRVSTRSI